MEQYTEEGLAIINENKENIENLEKKVSGNEEPKLQKAKSQHLSKQKKDKDYYIYKLVGVVVHHGNADAGHYYSYINVMRHEWEEKENYLNTEKDRWVEFNDSTVREFDFSKLESECFGGAEEDYQSGFMEDISDVAKLVGGRSKSAYLLIYEKRQKLPILEKIADYKPSENVVITSTLECNRNADSMAKIYKDSNNEYYNLHNFHHFPGKMPQNIADEVSLDNTNFLFEKLTFSKEFLTFLCDSYSAAQKLSESVAVLQQKQYKKTLCEIGDAFFIDIVPYANTSEINSFKNCGDSIALLFSQDIDISKELLKKFLKNPQQMLSLLVKCPVQTVREMISKVIVAAFIQLSNSEIYFFDSNYNVKEIGKDGKEIEVAMPSALSRQILDFFIGSIGYDLAIQWPKFLQFFVTLKEIVNSSNPAVIKYCFKRDLITILLDFFLEKDSPVSLSNGKRYEMGNQAVEPDFSGLIEIVGILCQYGSSPEIKSANLPNTETYIFSPGAIKCLQSEELIPKYLKCGGNVCKIGKLIVNMSNENKKYSKKTCKQVLRIINDFDPKKVTQHLDLIINILMISDSLQKNRFEWLLGFQQPIARIEYGLSAIYNISDEMSSFISPLATELHDDPLLHQLWSYKNRNESLTIQCFKIVLYLADVCDPFYHYLMLMPSPSYIFGNYFEWISNFTIQYSQQAFLGSESDKKDRDTLIAELVTYIAKLQKRISEDKLPLPQQYMIGKTLGTRRIKEKEKEDKGVKINLTEYETEIYQSIPTGECNKGLDSDYLVQYIIYIYLNRHFNHYKFNTNSHFNIVPISLSKEEKKEEQKVGVIVEENRYSKGRPLIKIEAQNSISN